MLKISSLLTTGRRVLDAIRPARKVSENLKLRNHLIVHIHKLVMDKELLVPDVDALCGFPNGASALFRGELDKFSLDDLVLILAALEYRVQVTLEPI